MSNAQITALSTGSFYNVFHSGGGTATLYRRSDGSRFVRLENFSVDAGPDLFVYTSGVAMPTSSELGGAVLDLGRLRSAESDYDVPGAAKPEELSSVVIWCKAFNVNFVSANLSVRN